MKTPLRVLIVEDSEDDAELVVRELSGNRLAEEVARVRPAAGVLYMSGYADGGVVGLVDAARVKSGLPFIQKPFTPDTILRKVREALDRRSRARSVRRDRG